MTGKFKKVLLSAAFALLPFGSLFGDDVVKILFLAPDLGNPANSAIFNGAADALKSMQSRYGKEFKLEYVSAGNSAERQLVQLSNAFLDNMAGAIVYPVDAPKLSECAKKLNSHGFCTVSVASQISNGVAGVGTDTRLVAEKIRNAIKRFSRGENFSLVCYFKIDAPQKIISSVDKNVISPLIEPRLNFSQFEKIIGGHKILKMVAVDYYGLYAAASAVEISRYDSFGEIFFSPWCLADASPIKRDMDRIFAISVGALPQFENYLRTGSLSLCVYDDYYGWGYFAARELLERLYVSNSTKPAFRLLAPLEASSENVSQFSDDWRKWLK